MSASERQTQQKQQGSRCRDHFDSVDMKSAKFSRVRSQEVQSDGRRWDIDSGELVIFTQNDELQNKFAYIKESNSFKAADDDPVKAPPNQSIVPMSNS